MFELFVLFNILKNFSNDSALEIDFWGRLRHPCLLCYLWNGFDSSNRIGGFTLWESVEWLRAGRKQLFYLHSFCRIVMLVTVVLANFGVTLVGNVVWQTT